MATNQTNARLAEIKDEFLGAMEEGNMYTALITAVPQLEALGMSQHESCVAVTRWAIEGGYFDPDNFEEVEASAEAKTA